jgi:hypothetical protein
MTNSLKINSESVIEAKFEMNGYNIPNRPNIPLGFEKSKSKTFFSSLNVTEALMVMI